jgi:hypothetical protein
VGEEDVLNIDLQVRQIVATACGLAGVDGIYSDSTLLSLCGDEDTLEFFWREIEREFDVAITRAQRQQLSTVGQVVHYLKVRLRRSA